MMWVFFSCEACMSAVRYRAVTPAEWEAKGGGHV